MRRVGKVDLMATSPAYCRSFDVEASYRMAALTDQTQVIVIRTRITADNDIDAVPNAQLLTTVHELVRSDWQYSSQTRHHLLSMHSWAVSSNAIGPRRSQCSIALGAISSFDIDRPLGSTEHDLSQDVDLDWQNMCIVW